MPATCPTCGEEALTESARFCVGCGGPLPEVEPGRAITELVAPPPPPAAPPDPRPDRIRPAPVARAADPPRSSPPPVTSLRPSPPTSPPVMRQRPPARQQPPPQTGPLRDPSPVVPLSLAIAGMAGLVALLLILVLARALGS